ncbi:MAG: helix-turn-helix domain-containing protein [Christensenellales bacterium]
MDIAERIKTPRKHNALSQEGFAERLGVTRQSVSSWENGTTMPDVKIITTMCEQFGVTADYLLFGLQINITNEEEYDIIKDNKTKANSKWKVIMQYAFIIIVGIITSIDLLLHNLEFGFTVTEALLITTLVSILLVFSVFLI